MKTVTIEFSDQSARQIEYFLRQVYGKRTQLKALCRFAIWDAVAEAARKDLERLQETINTTEALIEQEQT